MSVDVFFCLNETKFGFRCCKTFVVFQFAKAASKRLGNQANSSTNWSQRIHLPQENWKFGGEMKTINCDLYLYQTECYRR